MNRSALPIAILGGTFDPVHFVHLALARQALAQIPCGEVLWLPTGAPPYRARPVASGEHRVAMLKLALAGEPRYRIDERELAPGASGYTYDSVQALRAERPAADFVLVMGGDQYARRHSWHRWPELERLCRIAVAERPGEDRTGDGPLRLAIEPQDVSGSEIRARIGRGDDVTGRVPGPVLDYIQQKGLYR